MLFSLSLAEGRKIMLSYYKPSRFSHFLNIGLIGIMKRSIRRENITHVTRINPVYVFLSLAVKPCVKAVGHIFAGKKGYILR